MNQQPYRLLYPSKPALMLYPPKRKWGNNKKKELLLQSTLRIRESRKRYKLKSHIFGSEILSKKRGLGFVILNDCFLGCALHHINNKQIICIPKELHKKYPHNPKKPETMVEINKLSFDYLTNTMRQL